MEKTVGCLSDNNDVSDCAIFSAKKVLDVCQTKLVFWSIDLLSRENKVSGQGRGSRMQIFSYLSFFGTMIDNIWFKRQDILAVMFCRHWSRSIDVLSKEKGKQGIGSEKKEPVANIYFWKNEWQHVILKARYEQEANTYLFWNDDWQPVF